MLQGITLNALKNSFKFNQHSNIFFYNYFALYLFYFLFDYLIN